MDELEVWLQASDGKRWPVIGTCSIGRSKTNSVVVDDGKVSRRHVLIHKQDDAEYWVIDMGSGNGTFLNGRRVTLSMRLTDNDELTLGDLSFRFHQVAQGARAPTASAASQPTIINVRNQRCWLMVADIKGSTALAQRLPITEVAMLIGKWTSACKEIVDEQGGTINKFLGDGFLAYWPFERDKHQSIVAVAQRLWALRRDSEAPAFRLALHHGMVAVGGAGALGEDSLTGNDVALVFRMEKLAGKLNCDFLVSEPVHTALGESLPTRDLGIHELQGFEREQLRFYSAA